MKKKGQITIFIIIGVILVIAASLYFVLQEDSNMINISGDTTDVFDTTEVTSYISSCIEDTTFNGISDIFAQGGHYNINVAAQNPYPTKSTGMWMGSNYIPYWYHLNNQDEFSTEQKALCAKDCLVDDKNKNRDENIEIEIENYLDDNIHKCILGFNALESKYKIKAGEFTSDVTIRSDDVLVNVDYPIKITELESDKKISMKKFTTTLSINLNDIYNLADNIIETQTATNIVENVVLNMMSIYADRNEDALPPMADLQIGGRKKIFWVRTQVEEDFRSSILPYISMMQVVNTGKFNPPTYFDDTPNHAVKQGILNSMSFVAGEDFYPDTSVEFMYPDAPIQFKVGNSEIIKPENKMPLKNPIFDMMGFTLFDYSFMYDVAFPVIVSVRKENAYKNRDLVLNFAIEGNILDNVPVKSNGILLHSNPSVNLEVDSPDQLINRTIIITTSDKQTGLPVEGAEVNYICGPETYIGETKLEDDKAIIKAKYPFCFLGGKIITEHENYFAKPVYFSNQYEGDSLNIEIEMNPIKEVNVEIRKLNKTSLINLTNVNNPLADYRKLAYELSEKLNDSQRIIFNINRETETSYEKDIPLVGVIDYKLSPIDHERYKELEKEAIKQLLDSNNITQTEYNTQIAEIDSRRIPESIEITEEHPLILIADTYNVDMFMMYEANVTIPTKIEPLCTSVEVLGVCFGEIELIEYPEQNFSVFPQSSMKYDFKLKEEYLYDENKNNLVFFIIDPKIPKNWDDFEAYKMDYSDYARYLKPYMY